MGPGHRRLEPEPAAGQDHGADFFSTYTSQVWGNVAGGSRRGATYSGVLQFGADLDFEKMFGWQGSSFTTTWVWIAGEVRPPI